MLLIEILSGHQVSILYHGTDVMSAARILYSDEIKPQTDHRIGNQQVYGVSLTRSFNFASDWKGQAGAIFGIDATKLRMNRKIVPVDYYQDRREHEEFVIGDIKPLSVCLTGIYVSAETQQWMIEHDEDMIEGHKDYEDMMNHPLFRVVGLPKQARYYNPRKPGKGMFG